MQEMGVILPLLVAFSLFTVLRLAPEHLNSDVLMNTIMSLQNVTLFYWGANRILNLLPFLSAWIPDPAMNLAFVLAFTTICHFALILLIARILLDFEPDPTPPFRLAALFAVLATVSVALFHQEQAFSLIVWQMVYPLPLLIVLAAGRGIALRHGPDWRWAVVWLPLLVVAIGVNFAVMLPALFLALVMAPFAGVSRLRAALLALGSVAAGLFWRSMSLSHGSESYTQLRTEEYAQSVLASLRSIGAVFDPVAVGAVAVLLLSLVLLAGRRAGSIASLFSIRRTAGLAFAALGVFLLAWLLAFSATRWVQINEHHFRYFTFLLYGLFFLLGFGLVRLFRAGGRPVRALALLASLTYWGGVMVTAPTPFSEYHVFREADRISPDPQLFYAGDYWVFWPIVLRDMMAGHDAYGLGNLAEGNRHGLMERAIGREDGEITLACVQEPAETCLRQAVRVLGHVADWQILSPGPELNLLRLVLRPDEIAYQGPRLAALPSGAGVVTARGRATDGVAGCLFYGPYVRVPPGEYELRLEGSSGAVPDARADIVHQLGNVVLGAFRILPDTDGELISGTRTVVPAGVEDLEIRVCVSGRDRLEVRGYVFSRVASQP